MRVCVFSRVQLCNPMDCSPPGFSIHGISQGRILEWVSISFSRESFWPRDQTRVSWVSCFGRCNLYHSSKSINTGNSLVGQWLGLDISTTGGMGSIPGQGTKMICPHPPYIYKIIPLQLELIHPPQCSGKYGINLRNWLICCWPKKLGRGGCAYRMQLCALRNWCCCWWVGNVHLGSSCVLTGWIMNWLHFNLIWKKIVDWRGLQNGFACSCELGWWLATAKCHRWEVKWQTLFSLCPGGGRLEVRCGQAGPQASFLEMDPILCVLTWSSSLVFVSSSLLTRNAWTRAVQWNFCGGRFCICATCMGVQSHVWLVGQRNLKIMINLVLRLVRCDRQLPHWTVQVSKGLLNC